MQAGLTVLLLLASQTQSEVELVAPKARQGFFLGLGLRSAFMGANADPIGDLGLLQGGLFNFHFGQMVNNLYGFGMGLELGGGQNEQWATGMGGLTVSFHLAPFDINIAFHAAVGPAFVSVIRKDEAAKREDDPEGAYGALYVLGVTYDWFPWHDPGESGGFAITSFVEGRFFPTGDIMAGGIFAGVELSYWFGFGKNRLALEAEDAYKR
jgi:hypothetical protein